MLEVRSDETLMIIVAIAPPFYVRIFCQNATHGVEVVQNSPEGVIFLDGNINLVRVNFCLGAMPRPYRQKRKTLLLLTLYRSLK